MLQVIAFTALTAMFSTSTLLCRDHGGRHQNEVQEKARQDFLLFKPNSPIHLHLASLTLKISRNVSRFRPTPPNEIFE